MDIISIVRQKFGDVVVNVLEIQDYIPPHIEYQGKVFYINANLFKGSVEDWFNEKRWRELFDPKDIEKEGSKLLICKFFGANYELEWCKFSKTKRIKITPRHADREGFPDTPKRYNLSDVGAYILIERILDDDGDSYYVSVKFVEVKFRSITGIEQTTIESVNLGTFPFIKSIQNLKCPFDLTYKILYNVHDGRVCFSKKKFCSNGIGNRLKIKVDHSIESLEEALDEIKNKSVLYKFFLLL